MSIRCVGYRKGKVLLEESEPNVRLIFEGRDAHRFQQVKIPKGKKAKAVKWSLTFDDLNSLCPHFLLPALLTRKELKEWAELHEISEMDWQILN